MTTDPREVLDKAPLSLLQMTVVAITCVLNGLDGFDVLAISFASPGIMAEWGMERGALGILLSMELIGMAVGSIVIGGVADKLGRRYTALGCLTIMAVGMWLTPLSKGLAVLSVIRIFTGLGLGGLLTAINALSAEFGNQKRRHQCVSIMSIGYPIGGIIGGIIASKLLAVYSWRSVFYFGAIVTTLTIPVVYFLVPESVHWLVRKQPKDALKKINAAMRRMGHKIIDALPVVAPEVRKKSVSDLFSPGLARITTIVTAAYFLHIITYYFILKWVPDVVVSLGFSPSYAANILVCANIGGAVGGTIFGFLTLRFDPKKLTVAVMALGGVLIGIFGYTPMIFSQTPALLGQIPVELVNIGLIAFFCGLFGNTAIIGMFALFAHAFPTHVRASGTGFGIGIGRGGAILSPILVGFLFQWNFPLPVVTTIISVGSVLGAAVLLFLKLREGEKTA